MTTTASTVVVVCDPGSLDPERAALAGFLGGYQGLTRDAYALDLGQFVVFWHRRHLGLFEVHCGDVETFGRELEVKGRATATTGRRLCMVTGFYCYADEGTLSAQSLAVAAAHNQGHTWPEIASQLQISPSTARRRHHANMTAPPALEFGSPPSHIEPGNPGD